MRRAFLLYVVVPLLGLAHAHVALSGQIAAVSPQVRPVSGGGVTPVYEGWFESADGKTYALFGYFNRNTQTTLEVPVGEQNKIEPGQNDQGQPTSFRPGSIRGLFALEIPKERLKERIVWTLAANGQTMSVPVNLDVQYLITPQKDPSDGNMPPAIQLQGHGPPAQGVVGTTTTLQTAATTPLSVSVAYSDDGVPKTIRGRRAVPSIEWTIYRGGPGTVTMQNATSRVEGGKAQATFGFSAPGEYLLQVTASDGSRRDRYCCWSNALLKVVVKAAAK